MTLPAAEAIFLALADVDPRDRPAFLNERCGADTALRRDVEAMIATLDALRATPMPDALVVPRAVDQNAAHRQSGSGEEMSAPVPLSILVIADDAKVGFVDERRRLQRLVSITLAREAGSRELAQFVIHFGQHVARLARTAVAGAVG